MRAYRDLWDHPAARLPLVTSTLSRLTPGIIVLALVWMVTDHGYGWAAAGFVSAGHQIGVGLGSPVQGRLADRFGQPRVLVPDAVLYLLGTVALVALVAAGQPVPVLIAAAVVTGLVFPPTTACSRVLLSRLFPSGQLRTTAFALSSIAVEVGFIAGPLAAAGIRMVAGSSWAVVVAGVAAFVGAVGYATTSAAKQVPSGPRRVGHRGALRSPGVRLMALAFGLIAVVFGVFDIVVAAVADLAGRGNLAGPLFAAIASGSLLGGLVYGGRTWPGSVVSRLRVLIVVFAFGLLLLPFATGHLVAFAVALFVGGLFLAPTTICAFQLIDDLALPGTQTEAQSWTQSAVVVGVAAGAAMAGVVVEAGAPGGAFAVGSLCVGVAALLVNLGHDRLTAPPGASVTSAA